MYNKRITFFTSFEEMENDQLKYFASLQPEGNPASPPSDVKEQSC